MSRSAATAAPARLGGSTSAEEEWRPAPGFTDYFVSSQGRVMSTRQSKPRIELGRGNYRRVHRLVAEAFHGAAPEGCQVRHLNGDAHDNRAENLSWGTASENAFDRVRHGTHPWVNRSACPRGHEYTPENTGRWSSGGRICRECHRERTRLYQARRRTTNRDAVNEGQRRWRAAQKAARAS